MVKIEFGRTRRVGSGASQTDIRVDGRVRGCILTQRPHPDVFVDETTYDVELYGALQLPVRGRVPHAGQPEGGQGPGRRMPHPLRTGVGVLARNLGMGSGKGVPGEGVAAPAEC